MAVKRLYFLRTATRNFRCCTCNKLIRKDEQYMDWETHMQGPDGSFYINHKRTHMNCETIKPKVKRELPYPAFNTHGEKELIIAITPDKKDFITQDWVDSIYVYKRGIMRDHCGRIITQEDFDESKE